MKWHCLAASTVVLSVVCGCQADLPSVAAARPPAEPAKIERLQKPDSDNVKPASFGSSRARPTDPLSDRFEGQTVAAIRATVNGVPILEQEVLSASYAPLEEARNLPEPERGQRIGEIRKKVIEALIERELILQDANTRFGKGGGAKFMEKLREAAEKEFDRQVVRSTKNRLHLKTDEEFKNWLRGQGVSIDGLRRQFERQFIYQQYLQFLVQPRLERIGREEIVEFYQSHPEEFQTTDSVEWQDIFIAASKFPSREAAQQFAEQVRIRARAGEDFVALAKQFDNGTSSYQNGEGIGHRRGEIRPREVEPFLFQMRAGDVGPLVEQSNGFHVFRVVKRDYAGQMAFDEKTQTLIREKLRNEVFNRESKRVVADLRRKATIEVNDTP